MVARYRSIELDDALVGVIRHMDTVEEYRGTLQELQAVWDSLTLLGQMSGTGADMSGTRQAFQGLTAALLNQLANETLRKCVQEIGAKAQVAIDILVRNLYERTADIGFLATDEDVRAYLSAAAAPAPVPVLAPAAEAPDQAPAAAQRARLERRFAHYVAKYSVYSDIVLLDAQGRVMARLDREAKVAASTHSLVAESLRTAAPYVETFGAIDLFPRLERALVYSSRVGPCSAPLGVLCLCFRLDNELEGVFAKLCGEGDWAVVTLLDEQDRVIASSDPWHIPPGARLQGTRHAHGQRLRFGGQEYLAATRQAQGYQGYAGPGWRGHVMLPLVHAFNDRAGNSVRAGSAGSRDGALPPAVLEAVMHGSTLFGTALRDIPRQAERIQADLNRSVWNGNVRQGKGDPAAPPGFSKILLCEISNTGARTKQVFEQSIGNLNQTVLSSTLQECGFHAALAIDIMDRNLYERANDCRWWALTSEFRLLMEDGAGTGDAAARMAAILRTIHGLYTVYSNLLVFDTRGTVVAVSDPSCGTPPGTVLAADWVQQVLALTDAQGYAVSHFSPSPLYAGRHTYVYGAAIRSRDDVRAVGGVAIVFDAEPQFQAMLHDALPRDDAGAVRAGAFAVFVDHAGTVVASSDARHAAGQAFPVDSAWFAGPPGATQQGVVELHGRFHALGASVSSGYREYKGPDDPYRNDVVALVLVPLCEASAPAGAPAVAPLKLAEGSRRRGEGVELATFRIGQSWFAMRAGELVEAIDAHGLTSVPGADTELAGCLHHEGEPLAVFEVGPLLGEAPVSRRALERCHVVLVGPAQGLRFGILVDELGEIPEVDPERLSELSPMLSGGSLLAGAVVPVEGGAPGQVLPVLSAERLLARFMRRGRAANATGRLPERLV